MQDPDREMGWNKSVTRVGPFFRLCQLWTTPTAHYPSPQTTDFLGAGLRPSCRRQPTMPSIRVKTSRSFYKTLEEEAPSTPASPNRRPRSKSVIERPAFSGTLLQSPDPQSPRPQPYASNTGGANLSRVSQQISNSSREALPGPSTDPQYRGSNASQNNSGFWDEDQSEAVIDHLDVIGAEPQLAFRRLRRE